MTGRHDREIRVEMTPLDGGNFTPTSTSNTFKDAEVTVTQGTEKPLKRNFSFISMLGFTTTMLATWESVLYVNASALLDGGPVCLVYGFIFCFLGSLATAASLAEMVSMMPTSGGQYHWVAFLAMPNQRVFLSWITGWLSVLGWQSFVASAIYLDGTVLQALVVLNYPSYAPTRWQAVLFVYLSLSSSMIINTVFARVLPKIEAVLLVVHICGFFAILVPLVCLGPISDASFVFGAFNGGGGWPSGGVTWFIGLLSGVFPFLGYDGPCHMAEEVRNATIVVPWCMVLTILLNGALGFAMIIAFLFTIGNMQSALKNPTGYDFLYVFESATRSKAGATAMSGLLITMGMCATIGIMASASRQTWAFARDGGLPFSGSLSKVSPRSDLPLHAIATTGLINLFLALIILISATAFNAAVSLTLAGLSTSYIIPITLLMLRRFTHEPLKYGPWRLGRAGTYINAFSVCYLVITTVFSFFPPELPATTSNMNYSAVVFGIVVIFGLGHYAVFARKRYTGPIGKLPDTLTVSHGHNDGTKGATIG